MKVEELATPVAVETPEPEVAEVAPTPEPVVEQPAAEMVAEPSFFDEPEDDVLPEPAYQAPVEPVRETQEEPEPVFYRPAVDNVAQPSQETMARLSAAVQKQQKQPKQQPLRITEEQQRAEIMTTQEPERRGVLGGLISRMTGSAAAEPAMREQPTMSQEPQFHGEYEEMDADDDQVEVPAFLRRQAN